MHNYSRRAFFNLILQLFLPTYLISDYYILKNKIFGKIKKKNVQ
ncbi:unknown [Crocosphaera subtropica ATCC 51142]|uniref:Uncharacterized protein n=1 Tax=Crocosphaera subtropica (strain ATCC 51142 / BH68) TaxID=43989 RepID=B1WX58_CROS5|nr:unknown [Crocosphaera subtropica ATCC 51142]